MIRLSKTFLMGNAAIAMGALHAGVNLVAGYPGTPSTEILETVAKCNDGSVYVEWSVNEKAALEVAAGASYAGARTLVTMKQVGLNVASDPLMSLAYVGVKGGMVIVSADDPGPISSQTEQDTRHFAQFAKLPVFDPSTPEEAYEMIQDAFAYSEKYGTPVLFRPTTRVCHSCADIQLHETPTVHKPEGFVKDTMRWVIFPRTSYLNHIKLEERTPVLSKDFSAYRFNQLTGSGRLGIVTSGISYTYLQEALEDYTGQVKVLKIATANPFPEELALQFLEGLEQVLAIEELDPVLERALTYLCGKHHLPVQIHGKLDGMVLSDLYTSLKVRTGGLPGTGCHSGCTAAGTAPDAGASAGAVCRLSPPGILLRSQAGYEGAQGSIQRRHRLLHPGQRHAPGYGGYLSVHGCGYYHGAGSPPDRTGYGELLLYRGFHLLCLRHDGDRQRRIQPDGYYSDGAGQFHHCHDRTPAPSGHRHDHDA